MFFLLFIYFAISGTFNIKNSPLDVFSLSSSEVIASSEDWELHSPDNKNRCQYLKYNGTNVPTSLFLCGTIWSKDETNPKQVIIDTESNKHFLFGETRWYLYNEDEIQKEGYRDLQKVYFLIFSNVLDFNKETGYTKDYSDVNFQYMKSPDITNKEINDNTDLLEDFKNDFIY